MAALEDHLAEAMKEMAANDSLEDEQYGPSGSANKLPRFIYQLF